MIALRCPALPCSKLYHDELVGRAKEEAYRAEKKVGQCEGRPVVGVGWGGGTRRAAQRHTEKKVGLCEGGPVPAGVSPCRTARWRFRRAHAPAAACAACEAALPAPSHQCRFVCRTWAAPAEIPAPAPSCQTLDPFFACPSPPPQARRAREDFAYMLKHMRDIKADTTWEAAVELCRAEPEWEGLASDDERRRLFEEHVEKLKVRGWACPWVVNKCVVCLKAH